MNCSLCGASESSQYIMFDCPVARYGWQVIKCALNLNNIPSNIGDLLGVWLQNFKSDKKELLVLGCGAFLWTLWKTRNAATFDDKFLYDPTEIIVNMCSWLDKWKILQKKNRSKMVEQGSVLLQKVASEAFRRSQG